MQHAYTGWIDIPVVQAIEYFSGVLVQFYKWGCHYAYGVAVIGLCWSAFKLINSRFTVKEFWWDTLYKWLAFMLMMAIYPMLTLAMSSVANRIGVDAGSAKQAIITSLKSMKESIEEDLAVQQGWANDLEEELKSRFEDFTFETEFGSSENYNDYIDNLSDEIKIAQFDSKAAKKNAMELVNVYREKNKYHSLYGARTLAAINDILVTEEVDGTKGEPLTESYVDLNIWIKDKNGDDTCYLSPAAIMRVTVLGCQILWEKNQLKYAIDMDNLDAEDVNFVEKGMNKIGRSFSQIPTMLMSMLCCIILIACGIFACIQYLMTILEYIIITGIGAIFIPFILFDGTKEMPKKLIPVFTGFVIKIIVITICMFYVFYMFIQSTVEIMADNGGMNWVTFVTIVFSSVIAFVLTQNAPKIAMTLMTGQPQLSMGEFVQAAGTMAFGAKLGAKAIKTTGHLAKEGIRKTAQGTVNTAGGITKVVQAGKAASSGVKELGGDKSQQRSAMTKGMFAAASTDLKDKFKNAGNNFMHGVAKSGGGSGGGSGGTQAHQRSGQNSSGRVGPGDSRTLNDTSNPKFQNATRFDEKTNSNVNMTHKEFFDEKSAQGKNIGNNVALKMMEEAEKKQQAQKVQTTLPDNLTGEERASN